MVEGGISVMFCLLRLGAGNTWSQIFRSFLFFRGDFFRGDFVIIVRGIGKDGGNGIFC